MTKKRLELYWTEQRETLLQRVYEHMRANDIPCEYDGKRNDSAVIEYALRQQVRQIDAKQRK